ncbi:MAG TPA: mechanosensitive ion channel family protein [Acidilobales archaeon]|nr:mechanosensitive ion channel family protein [Acidilobales archaeon]
MNITDLTNGLNTTLTTLSHTAMDTWTTVLKFLIIALSISVVVLITLAVRTFIRRALKPKVAPHIYNIIEKVTTYTILIIGIAASLAPLGIDLTGLLVAGGIAGITVSFAGRTIFSNFLSGVFLYIERPIKIGDSVSIESPEGNISGIVVDIDSISTRIRSWNGYIVRIPNDRLFSSTIINISKVTAVRVVVDVGISYKSDVDKAKEAILKALNDHPYVLVNPQPEVYIKEFGNSAIVLRVRFWAPSKVWYETRKACLELIRSELKNAGIEIPYLQLDLHVKEPITVEYATKN